MWNPFKRKKTKTKFGFHQRDDFILVLDPEAAKNNDPHPWNIFFLGRIIKVFSVGFNKNKGKIDVAIKADVLYGDPLTDSESKEFGDLLVELVERNIVAKEQ